MTDELRRLVARIVGGDGPSEEAAQAESHPGRRRRHANLN